VKKRKDKKSVSPKEKTFLHQVRGVKYKTRKGGRVEKKGEEVALEGKGTRRTTYWGVKVKKRGFREGREKDDAGGRKG